MIFRMCLLLLFVFALMGGENEFVEEKDNVSEYLFPKQNLDTAAYLFYKENSDRYWALSCFLSDYFRYKKHGDFFSLDDDLTVTRGGYIYSKKKKNPKVWSSVCGVYRDLLEEQIKTLDSLENVVRKDYKENPVGRGERDYSLFNWVGMDYHGGERLGYVKTTIYEWRESEEQLSRYLGKFFERGCKKRVNEIRLREEMEKPSRVFQ